MTLPTFGDGPDARATFGAGGVAVRLATAPDGAACVVLSFANSDSVVSVGIPDPASARALGRHIQEAADALERRLTSEQN